MERWSIEHRPRVCADGDAPRCRRRPATAAPTSLIWERRSCPNLPGNSANATQGSWSGSPVECRSRRVRKAQSHRPMGARLWGECTLPLPSTHVLAQANSPRVALLTACQPHSCTACHRPPDEHNQSCHWRPLLWAAEAAGVAAEPTTHCSCRGHAGFSDQPAVLLGRQAQRPIRSSGLRPPRALRPRVSASSGLTSARLSSPCPWHVPTTGRSQGLCSWASLAVHGLPHGLHSTSQGGEMPLLSQIHGQRGHCQRGGSSSRPQSGQGLCQQVPKASTWLLTSWVQILA